MAKKTFGAVIVLGLVTGFCFFIYALANNIIVVGYNKGYEPTQPLPFSHEMHAGKYKIDCKYCHTGTETTRHALVPSLNICMNCHIALKPADQRQEAIFAKIQEAYNSNTPVVWKKVNLLPDHVKFNHSAHVLKGKQCQECHGPVENMPVLYQWSSLSMGFCVNCHRQPENNAPTSCSTCHY